MCWSLKKISAIVVYNIITISDLDDDVMQCFCIEDIELGCL